MNRRILFAVLAVSMTAHPGSAAAGEPPVKDRYGLPLPEGSVERMGAPRINLYGAKSFALSADGGVFAATKFEGIWAWDARQGKELWRGVDCPRADRVAVSPDGGVVAATPSENVLHLYRVTTGERLCTVPWERPGYNAAGAATCLCFSPDGKVLAAAFHRSAENSRPEDAVVHLWDLTGKEVRRLRSPDGYVDALAFSPDGATVATAACHEAVRFWDPSSGREMGKLETKRVEQQYLAFAPDGRRLACFDGWDEALVCEVPSGKLLRRFKADIWPGSALCFRDGGRQLALATEGGRVAIFDADSGKQLRRLRVPGLREEDGLRTPAVAADGKTAWFLGPGGRTVPWDLDRNKRAEPAEDAGDYIASVVVSPDGRTVATCGERVCLWDIAAGRLRKRLAATQFPQSALAYAPDGRFLATGDDAGLTVWDATTGEKIRRIQGHGCEPGCLTFVAGGLLAVAGPHGGVRLIDAATGRVMRELDREAKSISRLFASPDGGRLAAWGDGGLRLWGIDNGKEMRYPMPDADRKELARALAFGTDGKSIASLGVTEYSDPGVTFLWGAAGRKKCLLPLYADMAGPMTFSPDGRAVAFTTSFSPRGVSWAILLCETATGQVRRRFEVGQSGVVDLAFTPDGNRLVSGFEDGSALLWDVTSLTPEGRGRKAAGVDGKALWEDLADDDAAKAYEAACLLLADPARGLDVLRARLRPAESAGPRLRAALRDLDADDFDVREKASADLGEMGESARAALRDAAETSPSAEVRGRAARLLEGASLRSGRRTARAVEVLERMNSPASKEFLTRLAGGAPDPLLTGEAKAALERLGRRLAPP